MDEMFLIQLKNGTMNLFPLSRNASMISYSRHNKQYIKSTKERDNELLRSLTVLSIPYIDAHVKDMN